MQHLESFSTPYIAVVILLPDYRIVKEIGCYSHFDIVHCDIVYTEE